MKFKNEGNSILIGFLGTFCSGKSTIACSMFTHFKTNLVNTELILEEARRYIANKRFNEKLPSNSIVNLTNEDQLAIASKQYELEKEFKHSCGPSTIIISDSSVYNSFLYMSPELTQSREIQDFFFNKLIPHYDLLFYCYPVDSEFISVDPNRVHSKEQLNLINTRAEGLLKKLQAIPNLDVQVLLSDQESRIRDSCSIALNKFAKTLETIKQDEFEKLEALPG